jgi:3-phosphoshikimate 1-carboxyvinyltransferase
MSSIEIAPREHLDADVTIPGSKSCTARALLMAGLTHGESILREAADCDDTDRMIDGLTLLRVKIERDGTTIRTESAGLRRPSRPLMLGNSGTAVRFIAAACASVKGASTIDGDPRMRERPIADLTDALKHWGVTCETNAGYPPLTIKSTGLFGGTTHVRGDVSSQFLSGLMMAAPVATTECTINIVGELVSKPYVAMTGNMMLERGVKISMEKYKKIYAPAEQEYKPGTYAIEADASGASYFLAAAAIAGGRVRVTNLGTRTVQGDARFIEVLGKMGCETELAKDHLEVRSTGKLTGIDIDLNAMPDMAQTLAVVALFADGPTNIRNVANLRVKETDRIKATAAELRKLGATVEERQDGFHITPGELRPAAIDTYNDHRMAMSFAMAGLRIPGVRINDPDCVAKTFPDFFERFGAL